MQQQFKYTKKVSSDTSSTNSTNSNSSNSSTPRAKKDDGYSKRKGPGVPQPTADPALLTAPALLLSDAQVANFIVNGYLVLKTDLPFDFHQNVYQYAQSLSISRDHNPGNNILPSIPALQFAFDCPTVRGAVTSLLGNNYMMHPHRHPHNNHPGFKEQQWHQDSYWGHVMTKHHNPTWIMAMYYPQRTTLQLGPTAVGATSQYFAMPDRTKKRLEAFPPAWNVKGIHMECEAGTVVLIHYDIWHKGTANNGNSNRYMFKFQFTRMEPPLAPSWNNEKPAWPLSSDHQLHPIHNAVWKWMRGDTSVFPGTLDKIFDYSILESNAIEDEPNRLAVAYKLAQSEGGTEILLQKLSTNDDCIRRSVMYALGSVKDGSVAKNVAAHTKRGKQTVIDALAILGWLGKSSAPYIPDILAAINSRDDPIRCTAVDTLGHVMYWLSDKDVDAKLAQSVYDRVSAVLKTDTNGQVRFNACMSISRMTKNLPLLCARFVSVLEDCAWNDTDRYARANAIDALQRINTKESWAACFKLLNTQRHCSLTNDNSQF